MYLSELIESQIEKYNLSYHHCSIMPQGQINVTE